MSARQTIPKAFFAMFSLAYGGCSVVAPHAAIVPQFCTPPTNGICVKVVAAATGEPLAGVPVFVLLKDGRQAHQTITDNDGKAIMTAVPEDAQYIVAQTLPFVINGLRRYPTQPTYYIEACGGAIP